MNRKSGCSLFKSVSVVLVFSLFFSGISPSCAATAMLNLPVPGSMVLPTAACRPVVLRGLRIYPQNPLLMDFIVDKSPAEEDVTTPPFRTEIRKLVKYFLASLTIKENHLWVNLSPVEKNRTMADDLAKTELGRDMLAQDYILKQLTSSLIYPEKDLGKTFWSAVYARAREKSGTIDVPVDVFNKVWITADKAKVYEHDNQVDVVGANLKVMLESDYMAQQSDNTSMDTGTPAQESGKQVLREIIIPEIEKEVNNGANFALLRQIFYAMILATWYKSRKDAFLNKVYTDKAKIGGVLSDDPSVKEKIYAQYLEAYKKGVFNYVKDDTAAAGMVPRKYFSGGIAPDFDLPRKMDRSGKPTDSLVHGRVQATVRLEGITSLDSAQDLSAPDNKNGTVSFHFADRHSWAVLNRLRKGLGDSELRRELSAFFHAERVTRLDVHAAVTSLDTMRFIRANGLKRLFDRSILSVRPSQDGGIGIYPCFWDWEGSPAPMSADQLQKYCLEEVLPRLIRHLHEITNIESVKREVIYITGPIDSSYGGYFSLMDSNEAVSKEKLIGWVEKLIMNFSKTAQEHRMINFLRTSLGRIPPDENAGILTPFFVDEYSRGVWNRLEVSDRLLLEKLLGRNKGVKSFFIQRDLSVQSIRDWLRRFGYERSFVNAPVLILAGDRLSIFPPYTNIKKHASFTPTDLGAYLHDELLPLFYAIPEPEGKDSAIVLSLAVRIFTTIGSRRTDLLAAQLSLFPHTDQVDHKTTNAGIITLLKAELSAAIRKHYLLVSLTDVLSQSIAAHGTAPRFASPEQLSVEAHVQKLATTDAVAGFISDGLSRLVSVLIRRGGNEETLKRNLKIIMRSPLPEAVTAAPVPGVDDAERMTRALVDDLKGRSLDDAKALAVRYFHYIDALGPDSSMKNGGVELNPDRMDFEVTRSGRTMDLTPADKAMMLDFENGHFTGIRGIILSIVPCF